MRKPAALFSRRPFLRLSATSCIALALTAAVGVPAVRAQDARPGATLSATKAQLPSGVQVQEWVTGLRSPWGLALLPDGGALVTEKSGSLRVVDKQGKVSPAVRGVPAVAAVGQGGLLDVVLDPAFATNGVIYLSYAEAGEREGTNSTAVSRGRLVQQDGGWALTEQKVIFQQQPKFASSAHFGSRLVIDNDGYLYIGLGDRFSRRDDAQTLTQHHGKVVRIRTDGTVPPDNPFVDTKDALPEIWSLGHRNIQGAALHPSTGKLWIHEHGPQGGDEVNLIERGGNYGWPRYTYGENYGGGKIGEPGPAAGIVSPLHVWVPSIAPSGMAFYTGDQVPAWKDSIFLGALRGMSLVRLSMRDGKVVGEERLLSDRGERVRDVRVGQDGAVYVLTEGSDGKILRVGPRAS